LTRYQKLEKYAWFLLLRSKPEEIKKRATQLSEIIFENKIRQLLLKKVIEFKPTYSLEAFGKFLPEDFQQLVFDLYLQPQYARENVKKDPDDVARENPKGWRDLVKNSVSVYQFLIEVAVNEHDPKTPEGKRAIVKDLAIIIDEISHEVEKDYYLKEIAQLLGVKQGVVAQDIKQIVARKSTKFKKRKTSKSGEEELAPVLTRYQKLEKYAWFLLLRSKSDEVKKRAAELSEIIFENKIRQLLLKKVIEFKPTYSLEAFGKFLPEDFQQLVFDLYLQPKYARNIEELDLDKEWQKTFKDMRRLSIQEQVTQITKELDQLDSKQTKTEDEEKKQSELLEKIVKLRAR